MKRTVTSLLLLITALSTGCAQNLWWEAERSGWVLFGTDVQVPRRAEALPLEMLPEASGWNEDVYVEAWIDSVDQDTGSWMTITDGTTAPVIVFFEQGFNIPRNARGRRAMTWGRPMTSSGRITGEDGTTRTNRSIEFSAKAVLIQGFYGLESAAPRRTIENAAPLSLPEVTETPTADSVTTPEEDPMLELIETDSE